MRLFFKGVYVLLLCCTYISLQAATYYRTRKSGSWHNAQCWQTSSVYNFSGDTAIAVNAPDYTSDSILVLHQIEVSQALTIDQACIAFSGKLILNDVSTTALTLNDGSGVDLLINGILEDHQTTNVVWLASARWQMGENGTLLKTKSTSAVNWQNKHQGGNNAIPAGSNWIYQKRFTDNPSVATANAVYGNLIFENMSAVFWDAMQVGSRLTGTANTAQVKGNMIVRSGCKVYLDNSAPELYLIEGNLEIQTGGELNMASNVPVGAVGATGIEIRGDLVVDGKLSYNATLATVLNRQLYFSGSGIQSIKGSGRLGVFNLTVDKQGGYVQLNRGVTVDRQLYLKQGYILLNSQLLEMTDPASSSLVTSAGYLKAEDQSCTSQFRRQLSENVEYSFPFGAEGNLFPVLIKGTGNSGKVTLSTYGTPADNLTTPQWQATGLKLPLQEIKDVANYYVDRFWMTAYSPSVVSEISYTTNSFEVPALLTNWKAYYYDTLQSTWGEAAIKNSFLNLKANVDAEVSASYWVLKGASISLALEKPLEEQDGKEDFFGRCWIEDDYLNWVMTDSVPRLMIYDQEGRLLKEVFNPPANRLSVSELPVGLYYVWLDSGDNIARMKLMKNR